MVCKRNEDDRMEGGEMAQSVQYLKVTASTATRGKEMGSGQVKGEEGQQQELWCWDRPLSFCLLSPDLT